MKKLALTALLVIILVTSVDADEVKIVAAELKKSGTHTWVVHVTLAHADTGWDHYADNWQVVDEDGIVLGERVLYHPHVNEQPFTRSLSGVKIPAGTTTVFIKAHDKKHGWSETMLKVDLEKTGN